MTRKKDKQKKNTKGPRIAKNDAMGLANLDVLADILYANGADLTLNFEVINEMAMNVYQIQLVEADLKYVRREINKLVKDKGQIKGLLNEEEQEEKASGTQRRSRRRCPTPWQLLTAMLLGTAAYTGLSRHASISVEPRSGDLISSPLDLVPNVTNLQDLTPHEQGYLQWLEKFGNRLNDLTTWPTIVSAQSLNHQELTIEGFYMFYLGLTYNEAVDVVLRLKSIDHMIGVEANTEVVILSKYTIVTNEIKDRLRKWGVFGEEEVGQPFSDAIQKSVEFASNMILTDAINAKDEDGLGMRHLSNDVIEKWHARYDKELHQEFYQEFKKSLKSRKKLPASKEKAHVLIEREKRLASKENNQPSYGVEDTIIELNRALNSVTRKLYFGSKENNQPSYEVEDIKIEEEKKPLEKRLPSKEKNQQSDSESYQEIKKSLKSRKKLPASKGKHSVLMDEDKRSIDERLASKEKNQPSSEVEEIILGWAASFRERPEVFALTLISGLTLILFCTMNCAANR